MSSSFPTSPPLVALCKRQSWRASPHLIHTQPWWVALWGWNPGSGGEGGMEAALQQLLGNKTLTCCDWNTTCSFDKNKRDLDSWGWQAAALGNDSLDCIAGMMALLLLPLFQEALPMSICGRTALTPPSQENRPRWSRSPAAIRQHTQILVVPHPQTLTLIIFPSPVSASGGQCLLHLKWTDSHSLRRMRVWLLFEDNHPQLEDNPIKMHS